MRAVLWWEKDLWLQIIKLLVFQIAFFGDILEFQFDDTTFHGVLNFFWGGSRDFCFVLWWLWDEIIMTVVAYIIVITIILYYDFGFVVDFLNCTLITEKK